MFDEMLKSFIIGVTIVVVAVPEGLPLAVTISLAYSTMKMLADKNLIRVLAACETMGNATTICSDKTGTLTMNRMTVVQAWFAGQVNGQKSSPSEALNQLGLCRDLIMNGLCLNTTAVLSEDKHHDGTHKVIGNKTEGALLLLIKVMFHFIQHTLCPFSISISMTLYHYITLLYHTSCMCAAVLKYDYRFHFLYRVS